MSHADQPTQPEPFRLNIGGSAEHAAPGWKILDIRPDTHVDYVGDCIDLSQFADQTVDEVYASHVYEHISYMRDLSKAMVEVHRILKPGGKFYVSVPDLEKLCRFFLESSTQDRKTVMRVIYGGQTHPHDLHRTGLWLDLMLEYLQKVGFSEAKRVAEFGFFNDCSSVKFKDELISLNLIATK